MWNPHLVKDIKQIESVQRQFTKWLPGMTNWTYRHRLLATCLDSLELRQLRHDLIFTYKALSNKLYIDNDGNMIAPRFPALIDTDVDSLFSFNPSFNT